VTPISPRVLTPAGFRGGPGPGHRGQRSPTSSPTSKSRGDAAVSRIHASFRRPARRARWPNWKSRAQALQEALGQSSRRAEAGARSRGQTSAQTTTSGRSLQSWQYEEADSAAGIGEDDGGQTRHHAWPEDHPTRPGRTLRAWRQGVLPLVGADERHPRARRRSWRVDHGRTRRRPASSNPLVLAAAALAGVDRVFTIGGAQAVAALAYGTQTVCRRWTRLSAPGMPTSPLPSAAFSASSASTWSPAHRRSW
jgi:hypothetical protein